MDRQKDAIARAYARLVSLRENMAAMEKTRVEEKYVREFHDILASIESVGIDISEFRVPDSEVAPIIKMRSAFGDTYSQEKYVDKPFILAKLDAILKYFEITLSDKKPREIGFRTPDEQ